MPTFQIEFSHKSSFVSLPNSRWAYIILYLVVLIGGALLNGLFLWTVAKCPALRRTVHYLLACLAARDLMTCVAVVPFVISSQVWS